MLMIQVQIFKLTLSPATPPTTSAVRFAVV